MVGVGGGVNFIGYDQVGIPIVWSLTWVSFLPILGGVWWVLGRFEPLCSRCCMTNSVPSAMKCLL